MFHLWSQAVLFETLIRVRGSTEDSRKRFCFLAESIFLANSDELRCTARPLFYN